MPHLTTNDFDQTNNSLAMNIARVKGAGEALVAPMGGSSELDDPTDRAVRFLGHELLRYAEDDERLSDEMWTKLVAGLRDED